MNRRPETVGGFFVAYEVQEKKGGNRRMPHDTRAENLLERLSDVGAYPEKALAPYEEFPLGEKTYYFTPGGFLYRKDPGTEEVGGFFCGYLSDEVWHYRIGDG